MTMADAGRNRNRIREIRHSIRDARGRRLTLREVSGKTGLSISFLSRLERGNEDDGRDLRLEDAEKIAAALGRKVVDILPEIDVHPITVPVVGYVGTGERVYRIDKPGIRLERVTAPPDGDGLVAIRVSGDSLWPRYGDGDLLFFRPADHVCIDAIGRVSVVATIDGVTLVKLVKPGALAGTYRLISHRHPETDDIALAWASRVQWVQQP